VSLRFCAAALLFAATLSCRNAEGVAQDPVEREAEDALVAYVRIDTTNPPGNETAGATYLRDLLTKEGIDAKLVGDDPKRQAVYARLRSDAPDGKALLLLSHIDVVPADAALWRNPPFSGKREGGYIWGRGALDIKSLTIAQRRAGHQVAHHRAVDGRHRIEASRDEAAPRRNPAGRSR
jgi:acetylornithine deacetylase/succinyl-diaminopimelate desuccinylase-like protein